MNELQTLINQSQINRGIYRSRLVKSKKISDNQQEFSATFVGYDSATGRYICKKQDGGLIYATSITNGGIAKGSKVSLGVSATGIPVIDQIPR